jgi:ABC-type multidrug transport system permease subunit
VSSAPFHGIQRTVRTKLYESAGGILIWLVALGATLHRLTMRSGLFWIWILFAGVMGFFVGGSFVAALQTPLPTTGAARQTMQTDTSEPIPSRPTGSGMAGCPCGPSLYPASPQSPPSIRPRRR